MSTVCQARPILCLSRQLTKEYKHQVSSLTAYTCVWVGCPVTFLRSSSEIAVSTSSNVRSTPLLLNYILIR